MRHTNPLVCHISTFSPTQCGIATYTEDLIHALAWPQFLTCKMIFGNETGSDDGGSVVPINDAAAYDRAATNINAAADVVSLQHEFGIYGGDDGELVTILLNRIEAPIVTTMHTVPPVLSPGRRRIVQAIAKNSALIVVLTEQARDLLCAHGTDPRTVRVVRHGIPDVDFRFPDTTPMRKKLGSSVVFVSAGHLRRKKANEVALKALDIYRRKDPDFRYLILGRPRPHRPEDSEYRTQLRRFIQDLELDRNVMWFDDYLPQDRLIECILAADIGLATYSDETQSSSGIVPLMLGCGRPVVATPFDYATSTARFTKALRLVETNEPQAVYQAICGLLYDRPGLGTSMKDAHQASRAWIWRRSAAEYLSAFRRVLQNIAA